MPVKPKPEYDQAIAAICKWLANNDLIAITSQSGKVTIIPTEELPGYVRSKTARRLMDEAGTK